MMLLKQSMALLLMKKQTNEQTNKASICTSFSFKMWSNRLSLFTFFKKHPQNKLQKSQKTVTLHDLIRCFRRRQLKGENQSYNVIFTSQNQ